VAKATRKGDRPVEEVLQALLELNGWQAALIRDGLRRVAKAAPRPSGRAAASATMSARPGAKRVRPGAKKGGRGRCGRDK